jgi:hypothetical protein
LLLGPIPLSDDFFPSFQVVLVRSLADRSPDLSAQIAELRPPQLRLFYKRLQEERGDRPTETRYGLNPGEFEAFTEACQYVMSSVRFLRHSRDFLVEHFEETLPVLGKKLARLSRRQFERLYAQASGQRKRNG